MTAAVRHPIGCYALMLVLGLMPTALVSSYYDVLPNRTVIRWDMFGNTTIFGTRAHSVLMMANAAAFIALAATAVVMWQHQSLIALRIRRAFLGLNFAQLVAINLTCAMIVTQALGLQLTIKPMVAPAMAVLLFSAGVLCARMGQQRQGRIAQIAAVALIAASAALLAFSAIEANAVVGYYASAIAALAMTAVALPEQHKV